MCQTRKILFEKQSAPAKRGRPSLDSPSLGRLLLNRSRLHDRSYQRWVILMLKRKRYDQAHDIFEQQC